MAWSPALWPVLLAQSLHGFASCMLNPALAALTLGLVSAAAVAERLGRNARFAAIGSCGGGGADGGVRHLCIDAGGVLAGGADVRAGTDRTAVVGEPARHVPARPAQVAWPVREAVRDVLLDRRLLAYLSLHDAVPSGQRGDVAAGGRGDHQTSR